MEDPASSAKSAEAVIEVTPLDDSAVSTATRAVLTAAYRELRDAYLKLHELHHERITEALAERRDEGKKTGGDVPYGYRLDEDGETLIEDKAEQAVIAEAVRLREQGLSLRRIAQELWKQKLRPRLIPKSRRRGVAKIKRFGEFDPTQIRRMIEAQKTREKLSVDTARDE